MSDSNFPTPINIETPPTIRKKAIFDAFVEFCASPDPDRAEMFGYKLDPLKNRYEKIPSQKDFAIKYGVSQDTLVDWKKREDFIIAVDIKQKQWGVDLTANVMASLYKRCLKYGISADVELFLAYYKNWDRKLVIKDSAERFTVDDLRSLISTLPKNKQDDFITYVSEVLAEAELRRGGETVSGDSDAGPEDDSPAVQK